MMGTWAKGPVRQYLPPHRHHSTEALTQQRVLVGRRDDLELPSRRAVAEPAPATALNRSGLRVHLLLEVLDGAEVALERLFERAVGQLAAVL